MAILVQDVVNQMAANLDAEGNDYYTFANDYKFAINDGVKYLMTLINSAYGTNKLSEEVFKEVSYTRCFLCSKYSRTVLDSSELGHEVWTILSVNPLPTTATTQNVVIPVGGYEVGFYLSDYNYLYCDNAAKRLSSEQWEVNRGNPFMAGNTEITVNDLKEYAYINYSNYGITSDSDTLEIEIRPSIANLITGIRYAKVPSVVTLIGDSIPFPAAMFDLLVRAALRSIAIKQGDNTTVFNISTQDLITLFSKTT